MYDWKEMLSSMFTTREYLGVTIQGKGRLDVEISNRITKSTKNYSVALSKTLLNKKKCQVVKRSLSSKLCTVDV